MIQGVVSASPFATVRRGGPRRFSHRWLIAGGIALLLVGSAPLGISWFQQERARWWIDSGREALAQNRLPEARSWAQKVLQRHPERTDALSLLAEVAERSNSLLAVRWRIVAAESAGYTKEPTLALVRTALRFRQPAVARAALEHLPTGSLTTMDDWLLVADAATQAGDYAATGRALEQASALPDAGKHPHLRVRTALLHLAAADPTLRESAWQELETMAAGDDETTARQSLRALCAAPVSVFPAEVSRQAALRLSARPDAGFSDLVAALNRLEASSDLQFPGVVRRLDAMAGESSDAASACARRLLERGRSDEALKILAAARAKFPDDVDLKVLRCDAAFLSGRAKELAAELAGETWDRHDLLREAIRLRALEVAGESLPALDLRWQTLLHDLAGDVDSAMAVALLAEKWQRRDVAIQALKVVAQSQSPALRWQALQWLNDLCLVEGRTMDLLAVARQQVKDRPADHRLRNNLAYLSVLVGSSSEQAVQGVENLRIGHPDEPTIAANEIFHYWRLRRFSEARRLLSAATRRFSEAPQLGLVRVLVLASDGDATSATLATSLTRQRPLLPEERELVRDALRAGGFPITL